MSFGLINALTVHIYNIPKVWIIGVLLSEVATIFCQTNINYIVSLRASEAKLSEALTNRGVFGVGAPRTKKTVSGPILNTFFLHTFQMILSKKINVVLFFFDKFFFSKTFLNFLRIFWNTFWSRRQQNWSKTNLELKMKNLLNEKCKINRKIVYVSEHCNWFGQDFAKYFSAWVEFSQTRRNLFEIQRNLFEILLNQPEIGLYLPFSNWYGTKPISVWF